ncbi:MAG: hypothetical protein NWF03_02065 [Candidatus Bathyarchaeota archaeon]|nr:hypothetical protein [Candidatus Bathyarchaeota archaeon]
MSITEDERIHSKGKSFFQLAIFSFFITQTKLTAKVNGLRQTQFQLNAPSFANPQIFET